MDSKRNRIINLISYIESKGVEVNINKNKARGNKGFFFVKNKNFRIDISRELNDDEAFSVLLHEFTHFVHYQHDKKLGFPVFVFGDYSDEIVEELINITVKSIPKTFAGGLYEKKEKYHDEIKQIVSGIKTFIPDFKQSVPSLLIERRLPKIARYFLKYDRVNHWGKVYSLNNLDNSIELNPEDILYLRLKSAQRKLRSVNSKISRLNRYYNQPSELFARFVELYFKDKEEAKLIAPIAFEAFENFLGSNKNSEFNMLSKIL